MKDRIKAWSHDEVTLTNSPYKKYSYVGVWKTSRKVHSEVGS